MTDLEKTFRAAYDHALMVEVAKHLKTATDWAQVQHIQKHHTRAREITQKAYKDTYEDRVRAAYQDLLHKHAPRMEPRPPGQGMHHRATPKALDRAAHKQVRQNHARDMAAIDAAETRDLKGVVHRAGLDPERPLTADLLPSRTHNHTQGPTPPRAGAARPAKRHGPNTLTPKWRP